MTNANVTTYFYKALLAEASYADFNTMYEQKTGEDGNPLFDAQGNPVMYYNQSKLEAALTDEEDGCGFSAVQAKAFASKYSVVSHIPNTASGLSATIFKDNTGNVTIGFRGTETGLFDGTIFNDMFDADGR